MLYVMKSQTVIFATKADAYYVKFLKSPLREEVVMEGLEEFINYMISASPFALIPYRNILSSISCVLQPSLTASHGLVSLLNLSYLLHLQ